MAYEDQNPLVFPKPIDKERIERYAHYDRLGDGRHFDAFNVKVQKGFSRIYAKLRFISVNFAGLTSRTMADMLFMEPPNIDYDDKKFQNFNSAFFEENQLFSQLHESAWANSRRGDSLFKLRVDQRNPTLVDSDSTVIAEEVTPAIYFPSLQQSGTRNLPQEECIAYIFEEGRECYLHKEIHFPGTIYHEVYTYDKSQQKIIAQVDPAQFGWPDEQDTGVDRSLIFHIPNVRDGSGFWGKSDYYDLESLFFGIDNRLTKVDNILDKHSDPILAVPPGVIDEEGKINKEALGMFEVDNENPGFNKPEYIVWNANLDAAEKEVDRLVDLLLTVSEISPASINMDDKSGGAAESGRALKFKLLSTIRKAKRKQVYYDQAIKDMVVTAQELAQAAGVKVGDVDISGTERPKITWNDGIVNDEVEESEIVDRRIANGTMSPADGIARSDGLNPEEAKKKAAEIEKENGPKEVPQITTGAPKPTAPGPTDPKQAQPGKPVEKPQEA